MAEPDTFPELALDRIPWPTHAGDSAPAWPTADAGVAAAPELTPPADARPLAWPTALDAGQTSWPTAEATRFGAGGSTVGQDWPLGPEGSGPPALWAAGSDAGGQEYSHEAWTSTIAAAPEQQPWAPPAVPDVFAGHYPEGVPPAVYGEHGPHKDVQTYDPF